MAIGRQYQLHRRISAKKIRTCYCTFEKILACPQDATMALQSKQVPADKLGFLQKCDDTKVHPNQWRHEITFALFIFPRHNPQRNLRYRDSIPFLVISIQFPPPTDMYCLSRSCITSKLSPPSIILILAPLLKPSSPSLPQLRTTQPLPSLPRSGTL